MKYLYILFAAASFSIALGGVSHAAVSTTGQTDPSPITIGGSLDKYVNFTKMDTSINLGDLGGPQLIAASAHSPSPSTYPNGYPVNMGNIADSAEITFDSNSHIKLVISQLPDLSTTDANGIVDTLPTDFHIELKGRQVKDGAGNTLISNQGSFGLWDHTDAVQTYVFGHGPNSGINLSLRYDRSGLDDHAGTYSTSATMTWSDLG
jgi:hypothetical protein